MASWECSRSRPQGYQRTLSRWRAGTTAYRNDARHPIVRGDVLGELSGADKYLTVRPGRVVALVLFGYDLIDG